MRSKPLRSNGSNIKRNDEIPKEILEMSDDDPRLIKFMEDIEEERRKRHPNQTHEELKKNVDAVLQSRKKNIYNRLLLSKNFSHFVNLSPPPLT